jgi:glycerol-3-phosphate dehydrogenase
MIAEHFDIVVVGAGIQGAGIAQAAASYGYRVLVLEKSAIAAGTSSRSSKLIHGGLRYLETGQLALVRGKDRIGFEYVRFVRWSERYIAV